MCTDRNLNLYCKSRIPGSGVLLLTGVVSDCWTNWPAHTTSTGNSIIQLLVARILHECGTTFDLIWFDSSINILVIVVNMWWRGLRCRMRFTYFLHQSLILLYVTCHWFVCVGPHQSCVNLTEDQHFLASCSHHLTFCVLFRIVLDPYFTRVLNSAIQLFCIKLQEYENANTKFLS